MTERDRILRDIESLDADSTVDDLRAELADVREAIESHELRIAERRAIELARELEHTQAVHNRRRNALLVRLEREEPQELFDLRTVIEGAFNRHALSDPPEQRTEADREDFKSWFDRGQSLSACVRVLRGLWKHADWQERLTDLIDEHRSVLPELRHVHLRETTNA